MEVLVTGSKDEFSVVVLVLIGAMLDESVEVVEASVVGSTDLSVAGEQTVTAFNWLNRLPTKHYGPIPGEIFSKILRLWHLWIGNFLKLTLVVSKYLRNDSKIGRNQIL